MIKMARVSDCVGIILFVHEDNNYDDNCDDNDVRMMMIDYGGDNALDRC